MTICARCHVSRALPGEILCQACEDSFQGIVKRALATEDERWERDLNLDLTRWGSDGGA